MALVEERLEDIYGQPLVIDQCGRCGGFWFDKNEIFRITRHLADAAGHAAPSVAAKLCATPAPRCPVCAIPLSRLVENRYPEELCIWQCGACLGMWLGPDDLHAFYEFRQVRLAAMKAADQRSLEEARQRETAYGIIRKTTAVNDAELPVAKEVAMTALGALLPPWAAVVLGLVGALYEVAREKMSGRGT